MNRTGIFLGVIAVLAVVYFIISKAQVAVESGTKNLQQEKARQEQQAEDIIDRGIVSPQAEDVVNQETAPPQE